MDASIATPDRSVVSRGEVALNRAIEALRRLDSRHTHSNRLPVAHDVITQTNSPVYLVRSPCFVFKAHNAFHISLLVRLEFARKRYRPFPVKSTLSAFWNNS